MNQIIEVTEQQLAMMKSAGIVPMRTINPYESLFDTLIQDSANLIGGDFDSDAVAELKLNSAKFARQLFDKIFNSNTNEFEEVIEATAKIYDVIEKEVIESLENEAELLQTM